MRAGEPAEPSRAGGRALGPLPLPLLALASPSPRYVATEIGVSNWLVRYLDDAPLDAATLALSLFWGGLALGRFVSSLIADRLGLVRFADDVAAAAAGLAILAASLVARRSRSRSSCFAVAGFAAGPVYPMIMAIGGALYPGRASPWSAACSSSAAILGSSSTRRSWAWCPRRSGSGGRCSARRCSLVSAAAIARGRRGSPDGPARGPPRSARTA